MRLSRRHLLAGLAALSVPRSAFASEVDATQAMLDLLDDRQAAAMLGASWLKQDGHPRAAIVASLEGRLREQGWIGDADRASLRRAMAAAVTDDYRTGDMVALQGWQVARTQVELCALAYLATQGSL